MLGCVLANSSVFSTSTSLAPPVLSANFFVALIHYSPLYCHHVGIVFGSFSVSPFFKTSFGVSLTISQKLPIQFIFVILTVVHMFLLFPMVIFSSSSILLSQNHIRITHSIQLDSGSGTRFPFHDKPKTKGTTLYTNKSTTQRNR